MKINKPLITILMPAYNAGPYIREAIDSILAQTITDFELLIINDGSSDDTQLILATYSDARIRVVHQENLGLVKTLNRGLSLARGKWIARFDADDICYPERLGKQIQFMENSPGYVIIGSDVDYIDKEGNFLFAFKCAAYTDEEITNSGFSTCPFIHSSVMYLKDAVLKAGGYNEHALTFEDHLLWKDLAPYGKMANMHESLIKVRFNPASATIDEKWRGREFRKIKESAIKSGTISDMDGKRLKEIIAQQDVKKYQEAAYFSMIAKKYLWNQYNPARARENLRNAISAMPFKKEPYLLYLFSFFPENLISKIYKKVKKI